MKKPWPPSVFVLLFVVGLLAGIFGPKLLGGADRGQPGIADAGVVSAQHLRDAGERPAPSTSYPSAVYFGGPTDSK